MMRANIDIDERLMAKAQAASGLSTKKATVALQLLVSRERRRQAIARLAGIG